MATESSPEHRAKGAAANPSKRVAPWRYVVPNALTSMSLSLGLFVLLAASEGRFEDAGWWMVWCVLLDKADGTSARLLGATSKFGVQLDSLADLVVFGVAPAGTLMLLTRAEPQLFTIYGEWGIIPVAMALFVVCAALRLAKFNVIAESGGPGVFFGMPTTLAGGLLALLLLIGLKYELDGLITALPLITAVFALLMVSNLLLPKMGHDSGQAMKIFQIVSVLLAYVFGFMRVFPEYLLGISVFFALLGFGWGLLHRGEFRPGVALAPEPAPVSPDPDLQMVGDGG